MSNLKQQAEKLGIEVDKRWSDATIQAKIDAKRAETGADASVGVTGADADGPSKEAASGAPVSDEGKTLSTEDTPKAIKAGVVLDAKTLLQAKAIELHIEVDPEWDENRLRAEIQQAREGRADLQVKGAVPPAEMGNVDYDPATKADKKVDEVEVTLTRDYWDAEDNRVAKGTKIKVSRTKAGELLKNGLVEAPGF